MRLGLLVGNGVWVSNHNINIHLSSPKVICRWGLEKKGKQFEGTEQKERQTTAQEKFKKKKKKKKKKTSKERRGVGAGVASRLNAPFCG